MPGDRHNRRLQTSSRARGAAQRHRRRIAPGVLALVALVVAGCSATAAVSSPPPTPRQPAALAPTPPPTPMPGAALPATFRADGSWTVVYALPGDMHRERWTLTPTCDQGACDAAVKIRLVGAPKGTPQVEGILLSREGKWLYEADTTAPVDCTAAGSVVPNGATQRVTTTLVLATWPIVGTTTKVRELRGTRTVVTEPVGGSACARSVLVYPATGEPSTP